VTSINFWPKESEPGLIKTKNAMGIMTTELSPVGVKFVESARIAKKPVLDIGAAYGVATIPALKCGARVIACDISDQHLTILAKTAPKETLNRLTLDHSAFPLQTKYENNSLSSILISLVLHFLDGDLIEEGLKKCYNWLEFGGKLYITVMTPNLSFYMKAWPEFNKNVELGKKWPGIFKKEDIAPENFLDYLPPIIHLFDEKIISRALINAGFKIDYLDFFCYKNFPPEHRNNGKEFIGIVGVK
jgi:predicted SAM-dependent methyltransferase